MKRYLLASVAVAGFLLSNSLGARAQSEVTIIAPGSARGVLEQLFPAFEKKSGDKVTPTIALTLAVKKQVMQGDVFDAVIVATPPDDVIASGNVVAGTETPIATFGMGVAVRKGSPKPDISTPDAVKKMLLAAKTIACPDAAAGAAAGVSFNETLKKLGITEQIQPKMKLTPTGAAAMTLVTGGQADIAFTFVSEMSDPGIDVVGTLPHEISPPAGLVGFVSSHAKDPAGAKALLSFLSSPEAAAVYKAGRMQPGR